MLFVGARPSGRAIAAAVRPLLFGRPLGRAPTDDLLQQKKGGPKAALDSVAGSILEVIVESKTQSPQRCVRRTALTLRYEGFKVIQVIGVVVRCTVWIKKSGL